VKRLLLEDGTRLVYKSQLPPTVEPRFYERASSCLLPRHQSLGKLGACDLMAIEWIDAPLLRDEARDAAQLVEHGKRLVAQIGEIAGELPAWLDIGSREAWMAAAQATLERLCTLVQDGRFASVDRETIPRLQTWAASGRVLSAIEQNPRLAHGDLKADQVFLAADGYRIIDWQRPVVAPPEIDLVALLVSQNLDPRPFVEAPVVGIHWFLLLHWAVEAQHDLFPDFHGPLFDQWASRSIICIPEGKGERRKG
jgi:hypothetical protein